MTSTILIGSTGLVGRHILEILNQLASIATINTISRRAPASSPKTTAHTSADTTTWSQTLSTILPAPQIYFSALGTSRGAAGSFAAQRLIDYDLNLSLAQSAQKAGVKIAVLISSAGSSAASRIPYSKMKGELEDAVKELGFETTLILRPGLIVGGRKDRSVGQWIAGNVAGAMGTLRSGLKDGWAQDADLIARAAVKSGLMALDGDVSDRVWVLNQADIVKFGKSGVEHDQNLKNSDPGRS